MKYLFLFLIYVSCVWAFAQEKAKKVNMTLEEYQHKVDVIQKLYWQMTKEKLNQLEASYQKKTEKDTCSRWLRMLEKIEAEESEKNYRRIIGILSSFETGGLLSLDEEKERLLIRYTHLLDQQNKEYASTEKSELALILYHLEVQVPELSSAHRFEEALLLYQEVLGKEDALANSKNAVIIDALKKLVATQRQAKKMIQDHAGKDLRLRGIVYRIASFENDVVVVENEDTKKELLFSEMHLGDWLSLIGIRSFDVQWMYQFGLKYFLEKRYSKALENFEFCKTKGFEVVPFDVLVLQEIEKQKDLLFVRAKGLIEEEKWLSAEALINELLIKDKACVQAQILRCRLRIGQERTVEAYRLLQDIQKKHQEHLEVLHLLAGLSKELNNPGDELLWHQKILVISPGEKDSLVIVAKNYKEVNQYDKYLECSEKLYQGHSDLIYVALLYADALFINKEFAKAREVYVKLLEKKDVQFDAIIGLGESFYEERMFDEALEHYESYLPKMTSKRKKEILRNKIKQLLDR